MPNKPESELIADCKRGDDAALSELFQRHYPYSLRLARGILRSEEESEDVVQSAYLSAFQNLHSFRGDATFKTWITRIVTNYCLMRLREPRSRINWVNLDGVDASRGSTMLASREPTPETSTLRGEIASAVSVAAARLPRSLREVFHLYAISGLSLKNVAEATSLTLPATKTRLFRANTRMRSYLQPVWSDVRMRGAKFRSKRASLAECNVSRAAA